MNWHYVEQGAQQGPVSDEQLAELNRAGRINADTPVWREGLAAWVPFHEILLELPPAPPPQPPPDKAPVLPAGAGTDARVRCAECGGMFPREETIRHDRVHICGACKPVFLQKLGEGVRINTGTMEYAGFGVRFGAKLLDGLVVGLVIGLICLVTLPVWRPHLTQPSAARQSGFGGFYPLFQAGLVLLQAGYETFFLAKYGATLGKMACGLRVVTADGGRISAGRALGRSFGEILSGMVCYLGYFMVLFDAQKRALHDQICNTRVIHVRR